MQSRYLPFWVSWSRYYSQHPWAQPGIITVWRSWGKPFCLWLWPKHKQKYSLSLKIVVFLKICLFYGQSYKTICIGTIDFTISIPRFYVKILIYFLKPTRSKISQKARGIIHWVRYSCGACLIKFYLWWSIMSLEHWQDKGRSGYRPYTKKIINISIKILKYLYFV